MELTQGQAFSQDFKTGSPKILVDMAMWTTIEVYVWDMFSFILRGENHTWSWFRDNMKLKENLTT